MRYVTYGELQSFGAKGANSFVIVCKEKLGAVVINIENIVDAQQEEQGAQNAALYNSTEH